MRRPPGCADQPVDVGLGVNFGDAIERALAEFGMGNAQIVTAEDATLERSASLISADGLSGAVEIDDELLEVWRGEIGRSYAGDRASWLHRVMRTLEDALANFA